MLLYIFILLHQNVFKNHICLYVIANRRPTNIKTYCVFKLFENRLDVLLRALKLTFTKHCACAPWNPAQPRGSARPGTSSSSYWSQNPINLKLCLEKKLNFAKSEPNIVHWHRMLMLSPSKSSICVPQTIWRSNIHWWSKTSSTWLCYGGCPPKYLDPLLVSCWNRLVNRQPSCHADIFLRLL